MKRLIAIRHGKSSWLNPVRDHDRLLLQRGIEDAHLIGEQLSYLKIKPDAMWSSTAARALQTATIVSEYLDYDLKTFSLKRSLYTFNMNDLIDVISTCDDAIDSLLIFSHNHGLTSLVNTLGDQLFDNIPTTGVVVIDMDTTSWQALKKGITRFHIFPKELK